MIVIAIFTITILKKDYDSLKSWMMVSIFSYKGF